MPLHIIETHLVDILKNKLKVLDLNVDLVIGIGRGGLIPAVYAAYKLNVPLTHMGIKSYDKHQQTYHAEITQHPVINHLKHSKILIIDDVNDTGFTFKYVENYLTTILGIPKTDLTFLSVYGKHKTTYKSEVCEYVDDDCWIIFPWDE